jgi:hypothetical protein
MHRHPSLESPVAASLVLAILAACGDDTAKLSRPDANITEPDATASPIDSGGDGGGTSTPSGIAVVGNDYHSAALSLLDRDGNLLADGCLHSGSGGAGLATTLSGDVVLPSQVPAGGPLALIDRGNNAITWLDAGSCAVRAQLAVGTGFGSNPHDVVMVSPDKAYVVRQDPNLAPTPALDDFDEGNDVLIVDPVRPKIVGRIDLAPFAPAGVLPRADRALLVGGRVFVSLNAISLDYSTYGEGRLLIIDPATDQVAGVIEIPGVKNCGAMTYVATSQRLLVACGGSYGDAAAQLATSAIVAIDLGQTPPAVVAQVAAASTGTAPFSNMTVAALDGNTAIGVTNGALSGNPPDSLWSLPLDGRPVVKLFTSSEGIVLGAVLYDGDHHRVLAADGTMKVPAYLRPFDFAAGVFTAGQPIKTNPTQKLPPRALAFY